LFNKRRKDVKVKGGTKEDEVGKDKRQKSPGKRQKSRRWTS
jgi:hypothetical protein